MKARWASVFLVSATAAALYVLLSLVSPSGGRGLSAPPDYLPTRRPVEPCDICEPNGSLSQACGPLAPYESYEYFIRCTAGLDDDLYYFDLATPATITLDLTSIPNRNDYGIYLYDENKNLVCYSQQPGNSDEHVVCPLDRSGRYYVRVYPWKGCNDSDPYKLKVIYPTPAPPPTPTPTPTPPCNVHIDDFSDTNPTNDLGYPSGWELDPAACGTLDVEYTGSNLLLNYDSSSPGECIARYWTRLSPDAFPYAMLTFEIEGNAKEQLELARIGLSDKAGHAASFKVGDFLTQVVTETWQEVGLPLAVFATQADTSQLDNFFIELTSQGTIMLDSLRLEKPLVPLIVDNFNDRMDPNALGGGTGIYGAPGVISETAYITADTYDNSAASYAISYTLPTSGWGVVWETDLRGVDVSDYAFLAFYIRGANGSEKVNLDIEDADGQVHPVHVSDYARIGTDWAPVRVPLQDFKGVNLANLAKLKFITAWTSVPVTGAIVLDDLRFIADTLLVDSFCDPDTNNSLNSKTGIFDSSPSCTSTVTATLSNGFLRLDYDETKGSSCYSGYYSKTPLDLNPYRSLTLKMRGERCGQVAAISAKTVPVATDKTKLSDYLLDGITDQWQEVDIPLSASSVVTNWTQGDSYAIAFEAHRGASKGSTWWDDIAFGTDCETLWVDNFNDEDNLNALVGVSNVITGEATMTRTFSLTQGYGDAGAALALSYDVLKGGYAGWETDLRNVDLSDYYWLIFNVKGAVGGETPNVRLVDGHGTSGFVNIETYVDVSTVWQTVAIPLTDFGELDLTRIQSLKIVIEWEPVHVQGTLILDNIRTACLHRVFLPTVSYDRTSSSIGLITVKSHTAPAPAYVWDFETSTEGWTTYREIPYSRAVTDVVLSTFRAQHGNGSLALIMDLDGGDSRSDRGVAFIDLSDPLNLYCKPLSCWLYVPTCGLGNPAEPNQARLFVKDANGYDEYSTPIPVVRNQWFEVGLRPSAVAPHDGSMEEGFDPSAITRVGLQFRAGSQATIYRGKVYLDTCGWQEIDPASMVVAEACQSNGSLERMPSPVNYPRR